jgi:hypothetical protein
MTMTARTKLDFVVPGVEQYRLTHCGWVLVGATVPPDPDVPQVVNQGCRLCDQALDSLSMEQVLNATGIHCTHCGQLRRSTA